MMQTNRWRFFFVLLTLVGLAAALFPVFFTRERQLTFEDIERAQNAWSLHGPQDYTMLIRWQRQNLPNSGPRPDPVLRRMKLRFRKQQLVEASLDGAFVPLENLTGWDSLGVFQRLRDYRIQARPKDLLVVDFARADGHPRHWVWVHRGGNDPCREEVDLVLAPAEQP